MAVGGASPKPTFFRENCAGILTRGAVGLSGLRETSAEHAENNEISCRFRPFWPLTIPGEGKIPAQRLKARFLNVIYPSYQAAESFGRRKRKVSSTDRRSGAFENNLLESFLPVSLFRRFA